MKFYVGLHQPSDAKHFKRFMVSVNRLKTKKKDFKMAPDSEWIMDSGAFTELSRHGYYREDVKVYAEHVNRWKTCGNMIVAVSQDYMCEDFILNKTGLTLREHQLRTVERYNKLINLTDAPIMPVLQGYHPFDYAQHIQDYGNLIIENAYVGVGSVCKRNTNPLSIEGVLNAIKNERPDLRLHGFGIKATSLKSKSIVQNLHSSDSMAWCFAARRQGRNPNDWREAEKYVIRIEEILNGV